MQFYSEKKSMTLLRHWQDLIGTMLGFVTGADILAMSTAIQNDTEQQPKTEELHRVGWALLVEAQTLDNILEQTEGMRALIKAGNGGSPQVRHLDDVANSSVVQYDIYLKLTNLLGG